MRRTDGLSLIEILIAFAIISVTFTALMMSQITGFRVTRSSAQASLARDVASEHMYVLRSYGFHNYEDCGVGNTPVDATSPACSGSQAVPNQNGYTLSWTITNNPTRSDGTAFNPVVTDPHLLGVNVTVSWGDGDYTLSSFLSCADVGEFSSTSVPCPVSSLL